MFREGNTFTRLPIFAVLTWAVLQTQSQVCIQIEEYKLPVIMSWLFIKSVASLKKKIPPQTPSVILQASRDSLKVNLFKSPIHSSLFH